MELSNINHANSMRFLDSLPTVELINETITYSDFPPFDVNNELPTKTSCKYYSVNDYKSLNKQKNLNIFHANVNGLGSKLDNLHEFLSDTTSKMDVIAITETSEKEDIGFLNNVEIEGYDIYQTASETTKGGTAIYVDKRFDTVEPWLSAEIIKLIKLRNKVFARKKATQ